MPSEDIPPELKPLIGKALWRAGEHVVQIARGRDADRRFVSGDADLDAQLERAIELAGRALAEPPALNEELGGELLRSFVKSPDAVRLLKEIFVCRIAQADDREYALVRHDFVQALSLWTGKSGYRYKREAERLFDVFVTITDNALKFAIKDSSVAAQESRNEGRHALLMQYLSNIDSNVALLEGASPLDVRESGSFAERYARHVLEAECVIAPPSLDRELEEVPVDTLYVEPRFTDAARPSDPKWATSYPKILNNPYRVVVRGDPGGGKSTLAAKLCSDLATDCLSGGAEARPIPVLVVLRRYGVALEHGDVSLLKFITESARTRYSMSDASEATLAYLLRNGRAVVIFDGLDELSELNQRREIVTRVESFAREYPVTPIVVTSRRTGYDEAPLSRKMFTTYDLAGFDPPRIEEYVRKVFRTVRQVPDDKLDALVADFMRDSMPVGELRENPLMLGLLCNLYRGQGSLPSHLTGILHKCAVMMYKRWDEERGLYRRPPYESKLRQCMQHLANWIHGNKTREEGVTESELLDEATKFLYRRVSNDWDTAYSAAEAYVELFRGRAWVFTDAGATAEEPLFTFTHRVFQEFFAAEYLVRTNETTAELIDDLRDRILAQEADLVPELALQIKVSDQDEAANAALLTLLDYAQASPPRDAHKLIVFSARALAFVTPAPDMRERVVRSVLNEVVRVVSLAAGGNSAADMGRGRDSGSELFRLLTRANPDLKADIYKDVGAYLTDAIPQFEGLEQHVVIELALNLDKLSGSSEPAERDQWSRISARIAEAVEPQIRDAAAQRLGVAHAMVRRKAVSVGSFVEWHGAGSLFERPEAKAFDDGPSSSLAELALDAAMLQTKPSEDSVLADIGTSFRDRPVPWLREGPTESGLAYTFKLLAERARALSFERLGERERFGAFALLALQAERTPKVAVLESLADGEAVEGVMLPLWGRYVDRDDEDVDVDEASLKDLETEVAEIFDGASEQTVRDWLAGKTSFRVEIKEQAAQPQRPELDSNQRPSP